MVSPAVSKTLRYLAGIQDPEDDVGAADMSYPQGTQQPGLLDSLGQGIQGIGQGISQGISDAGSAIGSGLSSAAQTVQDAYAVPTEQRPPQYSGPSYAQPTREAVGLEPITPAERIEQITSHPLAQAGIQTASTMAGLTPPETALDVAAQAAPAPARLGIAASQLGSGLGAAALRTGAEERYGTDPLFTTPEIPTPLGTIPSLPVTPGGIGEIVGGALGDPTTYLGFGAAGRAADLPVQAALGALGRGARSTPGVVRRGVRAATSGLGDALDANAGRVAAADARMAAEGSTATPGVFGLSGIEPGRPEVQGMRPRIIPEDVADSLDYPIRLPEDPAAIRAIEAAGGTVDERGTTLNVIRNQDPEAAGGAATRSMTFYIAGPPGAPNPSYAKSSKAGPSSVGGTERIEGRTRFRNPLFISDAPGEAAGFDDAMRQMGAVEHPDMRSAKRVMEDAHDAERAAYEQRHDVMQRWYDEHPRWTEEEADAFRASPEYEGLTQSLAEAGGAHDEARAAVRALRETHPEATAETIEDGIRAAKRAGPAGSPERAQALKDLVTKYGGDPDVIDDLIALRGAEMGESVYAVKENIVAGNARRAGHDGVITIKSSGGASAEELVSHPAVVEAKTALTRASEALDAADDAHQAAPNNANWRAVVEANRRVEAAEKAWATAKRQAFEELASRRQITELADPREARNPTPGAPNPERERIKAAQDALEARATALNEEATRVEAQLSQRMPPGVNPEEWLAEQPELTGLWRQVEEAGQQYQELGRELFRMRGAPEYSGPPGYTLRPDIPRRAPVRESTIAPNPRYAEIERAYKEAAAREARYYDQFLKEGTGAESYDEWARRTGNQDALLAGQEAQRAGEAFDQIDKAGGPYVTAQASAGALPAAGRSDPLAAVNRVLGQSAISGVTGTTGGLVNQEMNPDDPYAFAKGFGTAALLPPLAQRGARGLARLAGARGAEEAGGALATLGGLPEDAARYRPELSREPVLPGMEPPRRAPGDAGPSISDVPNAPGTRLGNVPPSQLREPTLPGMEPPRRAPGDAGPAISDSPNRPPLPTDPVAGQPGIPGIDGFPDAEQALQAAVKAGRPSIWEWLKKAGYTGMLGPTTAVSQTVGGVMQTGLGAERAAVRALGSGRPGSAGRILAAPVKAVPEGFRALFDVLGGGEGPQGVAAAWGHAGSPMADRLSNPIAKFAANAMDRSTQVWAQGPDAFFSPMFRAIGEQEAAEKLASKAGRSADDLLGEARAVRDGKTPVLRADPDVRAVVDAGQSVADDLGFKGDPGTVGRTLQKLAGRNDAVGMLASYLLPFPAMTARSLKATGRLIPGVGELVGRAEGRDAFTRVHDQMLGAVGTAALGYYAANGGVTGSGPADKNERDAMIAQGWQPHSVAVGGYYLPTRYFQQWAPILDAVGEVHDAYAYGKPKDPSVNLLGDAAKRLGNLATDQVGLSQLNDLLNVLDGGLLQSGPGLAARSLTRYIPFGATIRQGTLLADPVARKPVTWRESGEVVPVTSTLQQIAQNLPGARGGVPERQDVLGRPLPNPNRGLASPRPDPLIRAYEERDLPISGPPPTVSGVELTPAQQRRYQQVMGAELQRLAGSAVTGGDWAQKSPQTQQILLETYLSVARTLAEAAVTSEGGETFSEARRKAILDRARGVAP